MYHAVRVPMRWLVTLVVVGVVVAGATGPVRAGIVSTSGTVTSGSSDYKLFTTQRIATQTVKIRQDDTNPDGAMRYRLHSCATSASITGYHAIENNQEKSFSHSNGCFRIAARRDQPKDTNGLGLGSGNTTFWIRVTF